MRGPRPIGDILPWQNNDLVFPERLDQGYVIVLPGVWGDAPLDYGLFVAMKDADVPAAVELYDWTAGALMSVYNLMAVDRNRREAWRIAQRIMAYQERYPGRPVWLVGYSGGGGMAVLTLEALPPGSQIARAILIAPTVAADYDLRRALASTEQGVVNFYSPLDVAVLGAVVTLLGTTDGSHTFAAGAVGFTTPWGMKAEEKDSYHRQIEQRSYQFDMICEGHAGGHFGWMNRSFVARHVTPLIQPQPPMLTRREGPAADAR
jgi:pimeloyl-ACP methyl ester carboxylesterase